MRILILTHGAPPLPGTVVVGNVLRAWSLGLALEAAGHRVQVVTRAQDAATVNAAAAELPVVTFAEPEELRAVVSTGVADALVVCQWDMLGQLPDDLKTPVAADLYAPRMLEAQFQGIDLDAELVARLETLARADFFLCTTERQKWFYLPWLMMAGVDCRRPPIAVVPLFPLAEPQPRARPPAEPVVVSGGVFWPWQDPAPYLEAAAAAMDRAGKGSLALYGGRYPLGTDGMKYADPPAALTAHPRVSFRGMVAYDDLIAQYRGATAALNVMAPNSERELSFSFRDVDYLAAGLPIIVGSYCEMAGLIRKYDAGWVVDAADPKAVGRAVEAAVTDAALAAKKSAGAVELCKKEFGPLHAIAPLCDWLAAPVVREKRPTLISGVIRTANGFYKSAEARLRDQEKLRELQERLSDHQLKLVAAVEGRDDTRRRLSEAETQITAAGTRDTWSREEVARLKGRIAELEAAAAQHTLVEERLARASDEKEGAARENGWLKDEVKRAGAAAKAKDDEAARLAAEVARLRDVETKTTLIPGLKAEIEGSRTEINRLKAELESTRTEAQRLSVGHEKHLVEIDRLKRLADERDGALRHLADERDGALRELAWTKDELKRLEITSRDLARVKDELDRATTARAALEQAVKARDEEVSRRDQELASLRPMANELNGIKSLPLYKMYKKLLG